MSAFPLRNAAKLVSEDRHPVKQALFAMERAQVHSVEPFRVVDEQLRVDAQLRYAAVLLAPDKIMRRQVVVLTDWTRCGLVKSLALPIYVSTLRRAQTQIRRSAEFYFLLHYPARFLDPIAFDVAMARLPLLGELGEAQRIVWVDVLERWLVHGHDAETIATATQMRPTQIRAFIRNAAWSYRRARVQPSPLDPFRFGRPRWGGFGLAWDDLTQDYIVTPEDRPPLDACARIETMLAEIKWSHPTSHLGLRPTFDQALPSQQSRIEDPAEHDPWSGSDDGIDLADLFAGSVDDLIAG